MTQIGREMGDALFNYYTRDANLHYIGVLFVNGYGDHQIPCPVLYIPWVGCFDVYVCGTCVGNFVASIVGLTQLVGGCMFFKRIFTRGRSVQSLQKAEKILDTMTGQVSSVADGFMLLVNELTAAHEENRKLTEQIAEHERRWEWIEKHRGAVLNSCVDPFYYDEMAISRIDAERKR